MKEIIKTVLQWVALILIIVWAIHNRNTAEDIFNWIILSLLFLVIFSGLLSPKN